MAQFKKAIYNEMGAWAGIIGDVFWLHDGDENARCVIGEVGLVGSGVSHLDGQVLMTRQYEPREGKRFGVRWL